MGLGPEANSTGVCRDTSKLPSPPTIASCKGETPAPLEKLRSTGCCQGEKSEQGKARRAGRFCVVAFRLSVTPVSARNKTSPDREAAVSLRLMNGPKNRFPVYQTKNRFWGRGHLGAIFTSSCLPPSRPPQLPLGTTAPLQHPRVPRERGCRRREVAEGWRE